MCVCKIAWMIVRKTNINKRAIVTRNQTSDFLSNQGGYFAQKFNIKKIIKGIVEI